MNTTDYWSWAFPAHADVNAQLRDACAAYHRRFGQRPWLAIVPREAALTPLAGLALQVNAFLPATVFYFPTPERAP